MGEIKAEEGDSIREEALMARIPNMSEMRAKKEGYRDYPIGRTSELFNEEVVDISDYDIAGQAYYSRPNAATGEAVYGISKTLRLRKSLAEKLADINERLKNPDISTFFGGPVELYAEDALRSLELQKKLYEETFPTLIKSQNAHISDEELASRLNELIAKPSEDEDRPSPHATGGAVDVILRYRQDTLDYVQGSEVPVGHVDGDTSRKVYPDYFEHGTPRNEGEIVAQRNRRGFYAVMTGEVFGIDTQLQVNPTEWWHWSYGDQMWAKLSDRPAALYGLANNLS